VKSSSGAYFVGLDHLRALAALLVFTWHFMHGFNGAPIRFGYAPDPAIGAFFAEGHWGVSLFMTLSGYLFARLLDGRRMDYRAFLWNRLLRLAPLLVVVFSALYAMHGGSLVAYLLHLASGLILPTLENGAWSITVEMHFYVMLPLLLALSVKRAWLLPSVIVAAIAFRAAYFAIHGEVLSLAYWTIIGRIDNFLAGIIAFRCRDRIRGRHGLMAAALVTYLAFYYWFTNSGGYYLSPYKSVWIVLPTVEAAFCAILIAWYDQSFRFGTKGLSGFLAQIGTYSYSIYLLHFFFVFALPVAIGQVVRLDNFYVCLGVAFLAFLAMVPIGAMSYHGFEKFFLNFRRKYIIEDKLVEAMPAPAAQFS
jgi:peptidoglycan/LPS O-acetylase OafA/YrhL